MHQLHFLPYCDTIIVLQDNQIQAIGTYKELLQNGINLESIVSKDDNNDNKNNNNDNNKNNDQKNDHKEQSNTRDISLLQKTAPEIENGKMS